jgi:hypothetical protein
MNLEQNYLKVVQEKNKLGRRSLGRCFPKIDFLLLLRDNLQVKNLKNISKKQNVMCQNT